MDAEQPDRDDELLKRAAAVLREIVVLDWRDQRKPVLVLRALRSLEERGRPDGKDGWYAEDIAKVMAEEGDKEAAVWVKEKGSNVRVRNHWKTLTEEIWPSKDNAEDSALHQRFRDAEMRVYAKPDKESGGGKGRPNIYRLILADLPNQDERQIESTGAARHSERRVRFSDVPEIEYLAENISIPKIFQWLPVDGLATRSWAGGVLLAGVTLSGYLLMLLTLLWAWLLIATPNTLAFLQHAVATLWLGFLAWIFLRRWVQLVTDGVAKAPIFWQPWSGFDENVLELRRDPWGIESPKIRLARYVADCPLCGKGSGRSAVRVQSGRIEFFGRRLVGRCTHAPNAHVWSFDHVTRRGRFLR
jgi:hypothetical protein